MTTEKTPAQVRVAKMIAESMASGTRVTRRIGRTSEYEEMCTHLKEIARFSTFVRSDTAASAEGAFLGLPWQVSLMSP